MKLPHEYGKSPPTFLIEIIIKVEWKRLDLNIRNINVLLKFAPYWYFGKKKIFFFWVCVLFNRSRGVCSHHYQTLRIMTWFPGGRWLDSTLAVSFKFFLLFLFYLCVCFTWMFVCEYVESMEIRSRHLILWNWLSYWYWESNHIPLQKQPILSSSETSLEPLECLLLWGNGIIPMNQSQENIGNEESKIIILLLIIWGGNQLILYKKLF